MAYPYQITNAAHLPATIFEPGPYFYGSAIYAVLHDRTNHHVEVWRSADAGVTWAEADSANHKSVRSSPAAEQVIDTFERDGDSNLYILYTPGGGTTLNIAAFDRAAAGGLGAWGAVITGGPAPTFGRACMLARLSTGDFRVYFTEGAAPFHIGIQTYSGSWSGTTYAFDPGVTETTSFSYFLKSIVVDASDNVRALATAGSGGNYRMRSYSAAGSLGALNSWNAFFEHQGSASTYSGPSILFAPGSATLLAFPVFLNQQSAAIDLCRPATLICNNAAVPDSVSASPIADDIITDDGSSLHEPYASLIWSSPALTLYYSWMDAVPDFKIRRACSKMGAWTAPTDVFVPASGVNQQIRYCSARLLGSNVGILFSSGSTGFGTYERPQYYQEALPSCAADSVCAEETAEGALYRIK